MLSYPMALATDATVEMVRQALADVMEVPRDGALVRGALRALVADVAHPITAEVYADLLGRPATARVLFSVENKESEEAYSEGRRRLAVVAATLAELLDAEACLTFQQDRVVMRRTGGELVLFDWFPEWTEPGLREALPGTVRVTGEDGNF